MHDDDDDDDNGVGGGGVGTFCSGRRRRAARKPRCFGPRGERNDGRRGRRGEERGGGGRLWRRRRRRRGPRRRATSRQVVAACEWTLARDRFRHSLSLSLPLNPCNLLSVSLCPATSAFVPSSGSLSPSPTALASSASVLNEWESPRFSRDPDDGEGGGEDTFGGILGSDGERMKGSERGRRNGPLALSETVATEACDEFRTGTERERRRIEREGGERVSLSVVFHFILFYFISLSSFLSFFYHLLFFFLAALLLPLLIYRCCRAWPAGSFLIFLFFTFFFFLLREQSRALPITPCLPSSSREHHPRPDHPSGDASLADYK